MSVGYKHLSKVLCSARNIQDFVADLKLLCNDHSFYLFAAALELAKGQFSNLTALDMECNCLSEKGLKAVLGISTKFQTLGLNGIHCLNRCFMSETLVSASLPALKTLDMEYNIHVAQRSVANVDAMKMFITGKWPHLENLNIECNQMTDKTLKILESNTWMKLKLLNIQRTGYHRRYQGRRGIESLLETVPGSMSEENSDFGSDSDDSHGGFINVFHAMQNSDSDLNSSEDDDDGVE